MTFKVLLIKPTICVRRGFYLQSKLAPPVGLAYLAGSLINAGYEVEILDMVAESNKSWAYNATHDCYGLTNDELIERIKVYKPNLVGIGGFTTQHVLIKKIVETVKNFNPLIKVVLGGINATAMPHYVLKTTKADFVIQGEGEQGIVALVKALDKENHTYRLRQ